MSDLVVRELTTDDRDAWHLLWRGYQAFYDTDIPEVTTDATWERFRDPSEPMWAFGAFLGTRLVGIAHVIQHRSTWRENDYLYLQDLFVDPDVRGTGAGRALIERVYALLEKVGADRVHWLTHETNESAMKLYDRIADRSGFVQYRKLR